MKNIEEGFSDAINVNAFKRLLKQEINRMSDSEAIDLWNNTIAKAAPAIALKALLENKGKPKRKTPKKKD
jgi:histone H3/H4